MSKRKHTMAINFSSMMYYAKDFKDIARKELIKALAIKAANKFMEVNSKKLNIEKGTYEYQCLQSARQDFKERFKSENYFPYIGINSNTMVEGIIVVYAQYEESDDEFFYKWTNPYEEENVKNG